jgi:Protein of unknown function (DUF3306)
MSNGRDDEPFLSRWSRQKRTQPQPTVAPSPAQADEPPFDPATLPNIDELTAESDIAAFMQKGVPEALQRLALRRMWSLDPGIRDFVEVAENQWDFNAAGGIFGLFQEIEPGANLSVWMAQATSSVLPPEKTAEETLAAIKPTAAEAPPSSSQPQPAVERAAAHDPQSNQVTSDAVDTNASDKSETVPQKRNRRHGGALPS